MIKVIWLLLGLGTQLQLFGASLSITELIALVFGPIFLISDRAHLKEEGMSVLINLAILLVMGCVTACIVNKTFYGGAIRGCAVTCILLCSIPLCARMLRMDLEGFKYFVVGAALSGILSTYIFKKSVEVAMYGDSSEDIMNGVIYWVTRIQPFVMLPGQWYYLHLPLSISALLPFVFAVFVLLNNVSGRSMALCSLAVSGICILWGKDANTMRRRCRHFYLICVLSLVALFLVNRAYRFLAMSGALGEQAYNKYMVQTKGKDSIGALLLGGRMESFVGLLACKDRPIVGWGPWAIDEHGYVQDFLAKYGDAEDYRKYVISLANRNSLTMRLAAHSVIVGNWLWYGIFGLVFWLYVLYVLVRYLKDDCYAVPQLFYWIAGSIPFSIWAIFFSPLSNRFNYMLLTVGCLMVRAIRMGRLSLPTKWALKNWPSSIARR